MKIKLDENFGHRCAELLCHAGHDVATVVGQSLCGCQDRDLIEICGREGRCLVTLDLDSANPLMFRPSDFAGIAVVRLPGRATREHLFEAVTMLAHRLASDPIAGKLWVAERDRIREYQPDN